MSPTIVLKDGKPVLVTGTPGGSRIISAVLQVIINTIDHGMDVAAAVAAPRLHHQWLPDEVRVERLSRGSARRVAAKGHQLIAARPDLRQLDRDHAERPAGAPDPRTRGAEAAGQ